MLPLRCLIVEDEKNNRELLELMILKCCEGLTVVGSAGSVKEAVGLVNELKPDILFLDISLPDGDGFHVLQLCDFKGFLTIFTTAYEQYSLKAFEFSAVHYLMKPISPMQLNEAISRCKNILSAKVTDSLSHAMNDDFHVTTNDKIIIHGQDEIHMLTLNDILYITADTGYTMVYLSNGKRVISSKALSKYEDSLTELGFFRIHHTYLVNIHQVKKIHKTTGAWEAEIGDQRLPISIRRKDAFMQVIESTWGRV
jgi:two-component system, LytTR family, response regulator